MVDATLRAFGHDIGYRVAHHADLTDPPRVEVHEYTDGPVWDRGMCGSGSRPPITGR
ncbi:metal-dependent hydrolase, beta-lactamase superfamily III [Mycolicibacterium fortuitum]|uniref:Metal-dependent hydrolase, beta-lactamase superfamily III n=1 Tax=Mycolicibacterium fortuitum TaxID=1766 RepID=A0A378USK9_MYCFO|nr:metal-dependent hydrolase, beta-lactamase superfamily III [Mycolicibacterium fortuitum]